MSYIQDPSKLCSFSFFFPNFPNISVRWAGCQEPRVAPDCPARVLPIVKNPYEPIFGFKTHPNSSSKNVIEFSEHLKSSDRLEDFEDFYSKFPSFNINRIQTALLRYKCFLYLHKIYPDSIFIPTLDVELVWRSHCIRPIKYKKDCEAITKGNMISHPVLASVSLLEIRTEALETTVSLWKKHFNADYITGFTINSEENMQDRLDRMTWIDERLEWDSKFEVDEKTVDIQISISPDDVLTDCQWFNLVRNEIRVNTLYHGLKLYSSLMKSYERYLFAYLVTPSNQLANPSLLIDLVWHAHMIDPEGYRQDMIRIVGHVIDHDPSIAQDDSRVAKTSKIWQELFGARYEEEHEFVRHLEGETVYPGYYRSRPRFNPPKNPVAVIIDQQKKQTQ
jgi:hypothetical protein